VGVAAVAIRIRSRLRVADRKSPVPFNLDFGRVTCEQLISNNRPRTTISTFKSVVYTNGPWPETWSSVADRATDPVRGRSGSLGGTGIGSDR